MCPDEKIFDGSYNSTQEIAFLPSTRPKKRMLWNIEVGATLAACNSTFLLI